MSAARPTGPRPVTVYLTAPVLGLLLALVAALGLTAAGAPPWAAVVLWVVLTAYLSRKRLVTEAMGTTLQVGAVIAVLVPLAPYLARLFDGTTVTAVDVATALFGPVLMVMLVAALSFSVGVVLKRRARQKYTRRAKSRIQP